MNPIAQLTESEIKDPHYKERLKNGMVQFHRDLSDHTVSILQKWGLGWDDVSSSTCTEIQLWYRRTSLPHGLVLVSHPWSTYDTDSWTWEMSAAIKDVRGAVLNRGQTSAINTYSADVLADWIFRLHKIVELELMRHELVPLETELRRRLDEPDPSTGSAS